MDIEEKLTEQERQFLAQLLSKLNINPLSSDAMDIVSMVQNIARKLISTTEAHDG